VSAPAALRPGLAAAVATAVALLAPAPLAAQARARTVAGHATSAEALEHGATAAEALGDTARAVRLYRQAAALDASGPLAPLALLRLTHPAPDTAAALVRRAAWHGLEALQRTEMRLTGLVGGRGISPAAARARPLLESRSQLEALVRQALDSLVYGTAFGEAELARLRHAYPRSPLLERYAAAMAIRSGRDEEALAVLDGLLADRPEDTALQRERAAALERLGRSAEAAAGYARALDLEPEGEPAFRALVRLREADGDLGPLLAQVRRLRVGLDASRTLGLREVEVLQRMGRIGEAQDVARTLEERRP
jgi:tetratricopeptide (TPR) repeat protein